MLAFWVSAVIEFQLAIMSFEFTYQLYSPASFVSREVEVKYPPPNVAADLNIPYPDLNVIVEQTLDVLLCQSARENAERKMAVLSFDPG